MVKAVSNLKELQQEFTNAGGRAVLVDFHATWCGPCKMIAPKLEEFSVKYSNVVILKVDVDDAADIAEKYSIEAMPTLILFKNGQEVQKIVGANLPNIESLISSNN